MIVGLIRTLRARRAAAPRTHRVPAGVRIYAVGDIHGRADLLEDLHAAIEADRARHPGTRAVEVYLGDYVDRGPASRRVLDLLLARRARFGDLVFLRGNHEATVLQFLADPQVLTAWRNHGGYEFLVSYGVAPPRRADAAACLDCRDALRRVLPAAHHRFLCDLRISWQIGDFYFVHAGIRPGRRLDEQDEHDQLWIRGEFLDSRQDFGKIVVHGHSPVAEPEFRTNRINIDTGAYATGRLTCLVLEADEQYLLTTRPS